MAKIFYSLAGEGRGHATRVMTMVELLRDEHEIVLFAPGDSYTFLEPAYRNTDVRIHEIPGLRFHYSPDRRLDYLQTGHNTGKYVDGLPKLLKELDRHFQRKQPDLAITDFEPALPRAAKRCGVPFISLNHQHFLVVSDLTSLPLSLQLHASYMSIMVEGFYCGQEETIVSSFYFPPLNWRYKNAVQVGVMMRKEILEACPHHGDYLLVYLRKFCEENILDTLRKAGQPVKIYGLGAQPADGNLTFHPVDKVRFLDDLAGSQALISTAGNQLVGEALYLGKPVLAMPELNNYEQYINAHFLKQSGAGDWVEMDAFSQEHLKYFLHRLDTYRASIDRERLNGNTLALKTIQRHLVNRSRRRPSMARSMAADLASV